MRRTILLRCLCVAAGLLSACILSRAQSPAPVFGTTVVIPSGLRGDLYFLPPNTQKLPGFSTLDPVGTIYASSLNIPDRQFTEGFPGVTGRIEWFAIDYTGRFWIEEPGQYDFALTSDDGAKLYIDGHLEIDNDGMHEPVRREAAVALSGGIHQIRISYFQGPRLQIALVLEIRPPHEQFRVFSTEEFKPPLNPDEWKYNRPDELSRPAGQSPDRGQTDQMVPANARRAFLEGAAALAGRDLGKAEDNLSRAVKIYPAYARAWSYLGQLWYEKALPERAEAAWRQALAADPAWSKAAARLASLELEQRRDLEAARVASGAIAAGATGNPVIYYCDAVANAHLGNVKAAEGSARKAIRLDMANEVPRARYLLGLLLADKGAKAEAIEHLRAYLRTAPSAADISDVRGRIALLEQLENQ